MVRYAFALYHHTATDRDYIEITADDKESARERALKAFNIGYGGRGYSLVCLNA